MAKTTSAANHHHHTDLSILEEGNSTISKRSEKAAAEPLNSTTRKNDDDTSEKTSGNNDSSTSSSSTKDCPRTARCRPSFMRKTSQLLGGERRTLYLRLIFVTSMLLAAAVCGVTAFLVTRNLEDNAAEQTYKSIATSALERAQAIAQRKQAGGAVLSEVLSYAFPQAAQWPTAVGLNGYTQIAKSVAKLSSTSGHGFMVIVRPDEVEEFETHAQQFYEEMNYPPTAGYSPEFGFGIYGTTTTTPPPPPEKKRRFHDITGNTTWKSTRSIMVPFLQHSNTFSNPNLLMMNIHQKEFRGRVMDSIMDCADNAAAEEAASAIVSTGESPSCGVVTDFTEIFVRPGPAAVFFQPIFPAEDKFKVVGFVGTSIVWEEVLDSIVPDYVDGLDCVISQGTKSFTWTINKGIPTLLGEGDLHDPIYEEYGRSVTLNEFDNTGASTSQVYTLRLYPTRTLFEQSSDNIPLYVALGFVGVIVFCTAIFFVYDFFMKHESQQRKKILELKRRFVRFISHEIRTPLNVVTMGLDLLQAELRDEMDKDKTKSLRSPAIDEEVGQTMTKQAENGTICDKNGTSDDLAKRNIPYWLDLTGDILENTQNAVSVCNDLLNYDKIETGTFKLERSPVDIWQLVRKTASEFAIQARNHRIALDVVTDDSHPGLSLKKLYVLGDDMKLVQVVRNLISNALKFSPEDGKVTVKTAFVADTPPVSTTKSKAAKEALSNSLKGAVHISVKDNGVGLTQDQLGQLFREGVQFDANKLQAGGGSGLGLCITKEIVEHHGGIIYAESKGRGHGTTFHVEIPLHDYGDDFDPGNNEGGTHAASTVIGSSAAGAAACLESNMSDAPQHHHILVVDDVMSNSKMLVRLLERAGHMCTVASNGEEAVEMFTANEKQVAEAGEDGCKPIDTILMDFEMPVMNGPDATRRLRELGCDKVLIIGVTGNVMAEDVALFKASGANGVLPKPIHLPSIDSYWSGVENSGT